MREHFEEQSQFDFVGYGGSVQALVSTDTLTTTTGDGIRLGVAILSAIREFASGVAATAAVAEELRTQARVTADTIKDTVAAAKELRTQARGVVGVIRETCKQLEAADPDGAEAALRKIWRKDPTIAFIRHNKTRLLPQHGRRVPWTLIQEVDQAAGRLCAFQVTRSHTKQRQHLRRLHLLAPFSRLVARVVNGLMFQRTLPFALLQDAPEFIRKALRRRGNEEPPPPRPIAVTPQIQTNGPNITA